MKSSHAPITRATRESLQASITACRLQTEARKQSKTAKAASNREWDRMEVALWLTPHKEDAS